MSQSAGQATVLLVEDDEVDAMAVGRAFRKQRIANQIVRVRDGSEALECLRGTDHMAPLPRPFLILLDLNMPRMSGLEFLAELRQDDELHDSIVFVLTTSDDDRDICQAYEHHVAGYLLKANVGEDFIALVDMLHSYWRYVEFPVHRDRQRSYPVLEASGPEKLPVNKAGPTLSDLDDTGRLGRRQDLETPSKNAETQIHDIRSEVLDFELSELTAQGAPPVESQPNIPVSQKLQYLRRSGIFSGEEVNKIERLLKFSGREFDIGALGRGSEVGGYLIESLVGIGGGGAVYKVARDNNVAALKFLRTRALNERFRREMALIERLAHPNIVVAYGSGEYEGWPYIEMEYLDGPDLSAYIQENGPVPWKLALDWVVQATHALDHAHRRKLIHRDVKPGNLLLHRSTTVKLADLGLAALSSSEGNQNDEQLTKENAIAGTVEFMAPEQATLLSSADARTDIYALGATWFYLLTGKFRPKGKTVSEQLKSLLITRSFEQIPDGLLPSNAQAILEKMLAYDPDDRFQDCADILAAFREIEAEHGGNVSAPAIRILVVEDDADDMIFTTRVLGRMNRSVNIDEASSLQAAREKFASGAAYDLVLLDLQLPDSMGLSTVEGLREMNGQVPVIVLTGFHDAELRALCLKAGANEYIGKDSIDVHSLERTIFVTISTESARGD